MKRIFKYKVQAGEFTVPMPQFAFVLDAQVQGDEAFMWAMGDDQDEPADRVFVTYGTGEPLPDAPGQFIATFQMPELRLVFHLFEIWTAKS